MLNRKNNFLMFVNFVECAQKKKKKVGNDGIRTHEHQNTTALNQQLKPLIHSANWCKVRGHSFIKNY